MARKRTTSERGSALIVAVGTLALISVLAALYVTIGQADQRVASSVERTQENASVERAVAEWIAGVVGDDRLDYYAELGPVGGSGGAQIRLRREVTDAPISDFTRFSVGELTGIPGLESSEPDPDLFTPTGRPGPGALGRRSGAGIASDPWLASPRPSFAGLLDARETIASNRVGRLHSFQIGGAVDPRLYWLDDRDWRHITNIAPDGRFVNLYNLRDDGTGRGGSNFDAPSGIGIIDGRAAMTFRMSLLQAKTDARLRATTQLPYGIRRSTDQPEVLNRPAWFTANQRYMAFPLNDGFSIEDRNGAIAGFDSPDYPDYQYADADGDGIADARWVELVNARDQDNPAPLLPEGDLRWFVGARVIDLSALVNVNTATDQLTSPTTSTPLGSSVAEIDLRRLLTMQDAAMDFLVPRGVTWQAGGDSALSYRFIEQPQLLQEDFPTVRIGDDYSGYVIDSGNWGGLAGASLDFSSIYSGRLAYSAIRRAIENDPDFPYEESGSDDAVPPGFDPFGLRSQLSDVSPFTWGLYEDGRTDADGRRDYGRAIEARDPREVGLLRLDYAGAITSVSPFALDDGLPERRAFGTNVFGVEDLVELLSFGGLNDPLVTSRLESVTAGRFDIDFGTSFGGGRIVADDTTRYDPLRSNRPLELERDNHDNIFDPSPNANQRAFGDSILDSETLALWALNPRTRLTTDSGATPLRNRTLPLRSDVGNANTESDVRPFTLALDGAEDVRLGFDDLFEGIGSVEPNQRRDEDGARQRREGLERLFRLYAGALLPELSQGSAGDTVSRDVNKLFGEPPSSAATKGALSAWDPAINDPTSSGPLSTLFYGHRGPEIAMRIAGHMAVNMADLYDEDSLPTVATLLLGDANKPDENQPYASVNGKGATDFQTDPFLSWRAGRRLVLNDVNDGADRDPSLPNEIERPGGAVDPERQIVEVYGIEAHPVITEAATLVIYVDTPETGAGPSLGLPGGENELSTVDVGGSSQMDIDLFRINNPSLVTESDINTTRNGTNPDLMLQLLLVEITNPFDEPVALNFVEGATMGVPGAFADVRRFNYYLEFGGRFFGLAPVDNQRTPTRFAGDTLEPGQSRIYYFSAHDDLNALGQRWFDMEFVLSNLPSASTGDPLGDLLTRLDQSQRLFDFDGSGVGTGARINSSDVFRMLQIDPRTGQALNVSGGATSGAFVDFTQRVVGAQAREAGGGQTGTLAARPDDQDNRSRREIRLWRTVLEDGPLLQPNDTEAPNTSFEPNGVTGLTGPDAPPVTPLWIENDQLVDRIIDRDAGMIDDDSRFVSGRLPENPALEINNTISLVAGGPGAFSSGIVESNGSAGLTLIRFGGVRKGDLSGTTATVGDFGPGTIPPWLVDRVGGVPGSRIGPVLPEVTAPSLSDFAPSVEVAGMLRYELRSFPDFLDDLRMNPSANRWFESLPEHPADTTSTTKNEVRRFVGDDAAPGAPGTAAGTPIESLGASLILPNNEFRDFPDSMASSMAMPADRQISTARISDLLLPLGVGPSRVVTGADANPLDLFPSSAISTVGVRWVTLGEALAAALGFEEAAFYNTAVGTDPHLFFYRNLVQNPTDAQSEFLLDNGRLRLDDYVAFVNNDDPAARPALFEPDLTSNLEDRGMIGDYIVGSGVPMAFNVLNAVVPGTYDPAATPGRLNVSRLRRGIVNINTAMPEIVRLLPGLAPPVAVDVTAGDPNVVPLETIANAGPTSGGRTEANNEWSVVRSMPAGAKGGGSQGFNDGTNADLPIGIGIPDPFSQTGSDARIRTPDAAASVIAYRDRRSAIARASSAFDLDTAGQGLSPGGPALDFRFDDGGFANTDPDIEDVLLTNGLEDSIAGSGSDGLGRTRMNGIPGIRWQPGLGSAAEVLAATMATPDRAAALGLPNAANWGNRLQNVRHLLPDFYGRDFTDPIAATQPIALGSLGSGASDSGEGDIYRVSMLPGRFRADPDNSAASNNRHIFQDAVANDYMERLALLDGILETTDVRSDLYAAWFVLRGYARDDVEGLSRSDPMTPTYQKRFLMIIDRSNVVSEGDRPRIVAFREVPL
ncbi:MAG: hypothetical protein AAFR38_07235 [Planctomycetota bacterium]